MPDQSDDRIQQALARATDTVAIVVGSEVLDQVGPLFAQHLQVPRAQLVADQTTWDLCGEQVADSLRGAGIELDELFVLPAQPPVYAGYENVELVRERLATGDACAVSIGSGTLNDLTKLASGELQRPYLHVCTAASMDGYTAYGAAITRDGFKITRTCPAPRVVVADLDVMATAPARMLANGYGDLIEKFPGGADWIVADELGVEPIEQVAWHMVQDPLRGAMGRPDELVAGDSTTLRALVDEIMLSGLAIQAHQSSRPGSGAGHNFSHQWEMEGHGLDWNPPLSHGAKVGLGTVAVCALYDAALQLDLSTLDVDAIVAGWPSPEQDEARVRALQPNQVIADAAVEQSRGKYVTAAELPQRIRTIQQHWPRLVERLREQLLTADQAEDMLRRVGAVHHPAQIGIPMQRLRQTYFQAQTIRSRYTIMDLLQQVGLFAPLVDALFTGDGYWARRSDEQFPDAG